MKIDIEALVADLQPVRPVEPRGGILLTLAAAGVAAAIVAAWLGLRPDIVAGKPHPMVMMREGMLLVLGFASLAAAPSFAGFGHRLDAAPTAAPSDASISTYKYFHFIYFFNIFFHVV